MPKDGTDYFGKEADIVMAQYLLHIPSTITMFALLFAYPYWTFQLHNIQNNLNNVGPFMTFEL